LHRLNLLKFANKISSTKQVTPILTDKITGVEVKVQSNKCFITCTHANLPIVKLAVREYSKKPNSSRQDSDSESDSDDEVDRRKKGKKHVERGDSQFWRRKMRTLHNILDVNKDGVISFDDLKLLAAKFTDLGHLSPEMSEEFLSVMKESWEEQFGEINAYNLVTVEQFLTDYHHRLNDPDLTKKVARFLPYLFKAVDTDHSGFLDLCQYKLFFRCLGLRDDDAVVSFAVIDKNGDGKLSMKEFVKLGRNFFLTEDERKISKMFWGPLVEN